MMGVADNCEEATMIANDRTDGGTSSPNVPMGTGGPKSK